MCSPVVTIYGWMTGGLLMKRKPLSTSLKHESQLCYPRYTETHPHVVPLRITMLLLQSHVFPLQIFQIPMFPRWNANVSRSRQCAWGNSTPCLGKKAPVWRTGPFGPLARERRFTAQNRGPVRKPWDFLRLLRGCQTLIFGNVWAKTLRPDHVSVPRWVLRSHKRGPVFNWTLPSSLTSQPSKDCFWTLLNHSKLVVE